MGRIGRNGWAVVGLSRRTSVPQHIFTADRQPWDFGFPQSPFFLFFVPIGAVLDETLQVPWSLKIHRFHFHLRTFCPLPLGRTFAHGPFATKHVLSFRAGDSSTHFLQNRRQNQAPERLRWFEAGAFLGALGFRLRDRFSFLGLLSVVLPADPRSRNRGGPERLDGGCGLRSRLDLWK